MTQDLPDWLISVYPFNPEAFITPRGAKMSYIDTAPKGSSEAVLMLHGNPTWSFYYSRLIQTLAPIYRCIAPDHIGMGLSDKPQDYPYTLETRIDDIAALVQNLKLEKIHLVVHDWGGAIGFGLASRHPELIGRIVILNTGAFPSPHIPKRIAICKSRFPGTFINRRLNGFAGPATHMSMHRRKLSNAEKKALLFPYGNYADRVAIDAFVKDIPMKATHPSMPVLEKIRDELPVFQNTPTFIVWGEEDFCFNNHFLKNWKKIFPNARVHLIPGAGHYVLLDADTEVLPEIYAFLSN